MTIRRILRRANSDLFDYNEEKIVAIIRDGTSMGCGCGQCHDIWDWRIRSMALWLGPRIWGQIKLAVSLTGTLDGKVRLTKSRTKRRT